MSHTVKDQNVDLYEDPVLESELLKPLTAHPNPDVPQTGVHLYHANASVYSAEARLLLADKGYVPYTTHHVAVVGGFFDNYEPWYARINPRCVVPTLVIDGKVTTDAHNMIKYAEAIGLGGPDAPKLLPTDPAEKASVEEYFDLAASVFLEALTYGEAENGPKIPSHMRWVLKNNHTKRYQALERKIEEHADDEYLKKVYETKLSYVTLIMSIIKSPEKMTEIFEATEEIFAQLNKHLEEGPFLAGDTGTAFLCGKTYSMADLLWSIVLWRLQNRGYDAYLWDEYPAVQAYVAKLHARPEFHFAVLDWAHPLVLTELMVRTTIRHNPLTFALVTAAAVGAVASIFMGRKR